MRKLILLLSVLCAVPAAAQAPKSDFFTTSDNVRIHYLEAGQGPALVFIPGWTMPADIWENQIAHFAKNYHVIAIDPRSQGESDKPQEGIYPERRARDYHELLASMKLSSPVLVGWSLGVPELMAYADQFGTAQVRALVLVDGEAIVDPSMITAFAPFLHSMQMDRRGMAEQFVKGMYKKPQSAAYLQRVVNASLQTPTSNTVALIVGWMGHPDWSSTLEKMKSLPVLYMGEPHMKDQAQKIAAKLPQMKTEIFPDAGHAIFVDEPEKFNRVLEQFLQTLPR